MQQNPSRMIKYSWPELCIITIFAIAAFWPWIRDTWSPTAKQIEKDMSGENSRWDWSEIWERHSLRIGRSSWIGIWFMLIMYTVFDKKYPLEIWLLFAVSTLGTAGISAYIMKLRSQKPPTPNEEAK